MKRTTNQAEADRKVIIITRERVRDIHHHAPTLPARKEKKKSAFWECLAGWIVVLALGFISPLIPAFFMFCGVILFLVNLSDNSK